MCKGGDKLAAASLRMARICIGKAGGFYGEFSKSVFLKLYFYMFLLGVRSIVCYLAWDRLQQTIGSAFVHEANLSLPKLSENADDFEEVFEAMQCQIFGVKQRMKVAEW